MFMMALISKAFHFFRLSFSHQILFGRKHQGYLFELLISRNCPIWKHSQTKLDLVSLDIFSGIKCRQQYCTIQKCRINCVIWRGVTKKARKMQQVSASSTFFNIWNLKIINKVVKPAKCSFHNSFQIFKNSSAQNSGHRRDRNLEKKQSLNPNSWPS